MYIYIYIYIYISEVGCASTTRKSHSVRFVRAGRAGERAMRSCACLRDDVALNAGRRKLDKSSAPAHPPACACAPAGPWLFPPNPPYQLLVWSYRYISYKSHGARTLCRAQTQCRKTGKSYAAPSRLLSLGHLYVAGLCGRIPNTCRPQAVMMQNLEAGYFLHHLFHVTSVALSSPSRFLYARPSFWLCAIIGWGTSAST